jgi:uncharacterized OB-fold protein
MKGKVKLNTKPTKVTKEKGVWVIDLPRFGGPEGTHHHTLGLLTPYFEGLTKGKFMGTKCVNKKCPISKGKGGAWLPPRADCPDCHQPMKWVQMKNPVVGKVFTYTFVERGGMGLEIECPYYQIDVLIPGVETIFKGYLVDRPEKLSIGDKVVAKFRTGKNATNTSLDVYWELAK